MIGYAELDTAVDKVLKEYVYAGRDPSDWFVDAGVNEQEITDYVIRAVASEIPMLEVGYQGQNVGVVEPEDLRAWACALWMQAFSMGIATARAEATAVEVII